MDGDRQTNGLMEFNISLTFSGPLSLWVFYYVTFINLFP